MVSWFKKLAETLGNFFHGIWAKFVKTVNGVIDWVWETIVYCCDCIWWFFLDEEEGWLWWIVEKFLELGEWFIEQLPDFEQVLGEYSAPFSTTMELCGKMNMFFPLTEAAALFSMFIAFVAIFLVAKLIIKLIPSIG